MKITYNKNPLNTTVELDELEQKILLYKIMVEELTESLFSIHYELKYKGEKGPDLVRVAEEADPNYYLNETDGEKTKLEKRCDELLEHYLAELKSYHAGDCTCVPCSCSKCHAEVLLGIDTIKGLGKHSAYKIDNAFGKDNERTIEEALEHLASYNPTPPTENLEAWRRAGGWEQHVPRWREETKQAHDWLKTYRDTHSNT
jgi:hypothetical protein